MHMAQSQELEAGSKSSETYLAENGGGIPASVQPQSCIRVQEGTGQNYLARIHGNGYITNKPRMTMIKRQREKESVTTYRNAIHQFLAQYPAATLNRGSATSVMTGATVSGPM